MAGGPGQAATELGLIYERMLRRARQGRETILIDQRGTGKSNPFTCTLDVNPLANGGDIARACLAQTTQQTEHYISDAFIKDLEMVRAAFGHEQISIMGVSYGTRAALLYAKAHEDRLRAMVLDSVAPPNIPIFRDADKHASTVLERTIADCLSDADCGEAFPQLEGSLQSLLTNLDNNPVTLTVPDTDNITVDIDRNIFLSGFRGALYAPPATRLIPFIVNEANKGNFDPWLALTDFGAQEINGGISMGLMMSVQCAEEIPLLVGENTPATAAFFPNSLSLFWQDACTVWPSGNPPAGFNDAVSVATPTLLLSGALDPITPPSMGDLAAQTLSNSVHFIAPNAGHSVVSYGCANRIIGEFFDHADPAQLDGECLNEISKPDFTAARYGPKP